MMKVDFYSRRASEERAKAERALGEGERQGRLELARIFESRILPVQRPLD